MDCDKVIAQLSDYYDGELNRELAGEVESHLAKCRVCANELSNFESVSGMLKSIDAPLDRSYAQVPSWQQFVSRHDVNNRKLASNTKHYSHRMFALAIGAAVLAASILMIVRSTTKTIPAPVAHNHSHAPSSNLDVAIDFEKLLEGESSQPIAVLTSLSKTFDGRKVAIDVSESELGYKPSISQALPGGVKLVSNHILKLPQCNCAVGECSCGPSGCNCAASLCKRADGSEFLVIEHCETQNVSFGHLKSELLSDEKNEVQLMDTGKQLVASWILEHRRLTAIGLNGKSEALAIMAGIASH